MGNTSNLPQHGPTTTSSFIPAGRTGVPFSQMAVMPQPGVYQGGGRKSNMPHPSQVTVHSVSPAQLFAIPPGLAQAAQKAMTTIQSSSGATQSSQITSTATHGRGGNFKSIISLTLRVLDSTSTAQPPSPSQTGSSSTVVSTSNG